METLRITETHLPQYTLLLLLDLLLGLALVGLLVGGGLEEAVLLGDLGGLDAVLWHRHDVLDGVLVVGPRRVVLHHRDDGDRHRDHDANVDLDEGELVSQFLFKMN